MSEIIELIITYVIAYLLSLAIGLPIIWLIFRKTEKHVSDSIRELRENRAALDESLDESHIARSQSQDEVSAQVDEIGESVGEIDEDIGEMSEDIDEIHESSDEKDEYLEGLIEFTRIMRDYSDYKTKMIEARENFCESQFSDEKNIH